MKELLALLLGLLAPPALVLYLFRLVTRDGLGTIATPRSHRAELGTWIDQELGR